MDPIQAAQTILAEIIAWRRQLHSMPEIGWELEQTSRFVQDRLREMGIDYQIIGGTGICALIAAPPFAVTKQRSVIALRADMDALVLQEETGHPFAAVNGNMHACGHDAHTAMLLGAAKLLQMNRERLKGAVKLIFQPAEEKPGGAQPMIAAGCLEHPRVDAILGLHVGQLFPELTGGMIGTRSGPVMGSVDRFAVSVTGQGGHGATPNRCVDPIPVAAEMITTLQRIVSREIDPLRPAVLTVGMIQGGTAFNIIPETVRFEGTVRTLNTEDRTFIERRIEEICRAIAAANRTTVTLEYEHYYPVLINDAQMTATFAQSAAKIVGPEKIVHLKDPTLVAEDMSFYLQHTAGAFFFLGTNNPAKGIVYPNHHPKFTVDEDMLWIGPAFFVQAVLDYFEAAS